MTVRAISAGRCRERRYADHTFIQIYFRMHHFVVKFAKFSSSGGKGHWPPCNQNPADVPVAWPQNFSYATWLLKERDITAAKQEQNVVKDLFTAYWPSNVIYRPSMITRQCWNAFPRWILSFRYYTYSDTVTTAHCSLLCHCEIECCLYRVVQNKPDCLLLLSKFCISTTEHVSMTVYM